MTRAVSVLEVERAALWDVLAAALPLEALTERSLGPTTRVVTPAFDRALPDLRRKGVPVLVRYARRSAAAVEAARQDLAGRVAALPDEAREVLVRAQRHARDGVVIGSHAWDPLEEAPWVDTLYGAGLLEELPGDAPPRHGRYRLHRDLPEPPAHPYDFEEAAMDETEDLPPAGASPVTVLHDLAALSAALSHHAPRRTLSGTLDKATARRLGRRLGSEALAADGELEADPRWSRALEALEALGAVALDPVTRTLHTEPHLEALLEGSAADALDRLVHRLVDPDLQAALPAVRAALAQAGEGAVDEMIFLELLAEQHRAVVFCAWRRDGEQVYPDWNAERRLAWTPAAFEVVEGRLLRELLRLVQRVGLIRRAPGVFAATPDGRLWASGVDRPGPPVWVGSDLELLVPPDAVTPWERYQLERLGRCLSRDVVDRYKLEAEGLEAWLATHALDDALGLLRRRCPGVPPSVIDTLRQWERSATRFVLTRGVLIDD